MDNEEKNLKNDVERSYMAYGEWITIYPTVVSEEAKHVQNDSGEESQSYGSGNLDTNIDAEPKTQEDSSESSYGDSNSIQVDDMVRFVDPFSMIEDLERDIDDLKSMIQKLEENYSKTRRDLESVIDEYSQIRDRLSRLDTDIDSIKKNIGDIAEKIEGMATSRSWINIVAETIGVWKAKQCSYNVDNICSAWNIGQIMAKEIMKVFGDRSIVNYDGKYRINLEKAYHICSFCPLFRRVESR